MRPAAADAEVEHGPMVAVAKDLGIRTELLVVAALAIADHRVGGVPRPAQQVGGEGQARLFDPAVGGVVKVEEPAAVLDQPGLVDAILFPASAVCILDGQDRRVFGSPPRHAVVAAGHAFIARPQFVAALPRVAAVQRPVLAVAPLEPSRRPDVVGLVQERTEHAAAVVELVRRTEAHRQPRLGPLDQIGALDDERVVALAVKRDEAHVPLVRLPGQLEDARHVRAVELLVTGDVRLGANHVPGLVMPVAVGRGPVVQRRRVDLRRRGGFGRVDRVQRDQQ